MEICCARIPEVSLKAPSDSRRVELFQSNTSPHLLLFLFVYRIFPGKVSLYISFWFSQFMLMLNISFKYIRIETV